MWRGKINFGGDLLSHTGLCSTIGAEELNFRVRDGNGCTLFAIATENRLKFVTTTYTRYVMPSNIKKI